MHKNTAKAYMGNIFDKRITITVYDLLLEII